MKQCNKCGILKDLSSYSKKSSKIDGLSSICKYCISLKTKDYYEKNRDILIEKSSKYFLDNREYLYEYKRKWYNDNLEKVTEYQRERYKTVDYKIKRKIRKHKRRAIEADAYNDGSITKDNLDRLFIIQNYKCGYCGCDIDESNSHLDHINPLSKGGSHTIGNVHWTCPKCNLSKGAKPHELFILLSSSNKQ